MTATQGAEDGAGAAGATDAAGAAGAPGAGATGAAAVPLHAARRGAGGVPLVIAHGLFGSARNWAALASRLSDRGAVVAVDMRNHGASPHDARHDYPAMAADLAAAGPQPFDLLGHSMGGKAAMVLALTRPGAVRRLVVADIAPVAYPRSQMALVDAMRALPLNRIASRAEADRLLAAEVDAPELRAFLLQSLAVADRRWALNLDALADGMDAIMGWPDSVRPDSTRDSGPFDGPALFLTGGDSDYVDAAGREAALALFPAAQFVAVPGAGHWLNATHPRAVETEVRAFLGR